MLSRWKWCLALELLLLFVLVIDTQGPSAQKNVVSGSNTTLQLFERQLADYAHLTWLYTTRQKILEWDGINVRYFNSTFKGRVMLDSQTPALHMYNIRKEDSGSYYLRVLKDKTEEQRMVTLNVLDPVPKPFIKIEKTETLDDACFLKLSCAVKSQTVDYTWYRDTGPFPKELESVLEITINPQNQSRFYTCQVSNLVSSQNDTVYFTPPCALARSSGGTWTAAWPVIVIPLVLVCLLTRDELSRLKNETSRPSATILWTRKEAVLQGRGECAVELQWPVS